MVCSGALLWAHTIFTPTYAYWTHAKFVPYAYVVRKSLRIDSIGERMPNTGLDAIREQFSFKGEYVGDSRENGGHINDTIALRFRQEDGSELRYILQRVNHNVFHHPEEVMDNIARVTAYLRERIAEAGGDPARETLTLIPTVAGAYYARDDAGNYWRAYAFIEGATAYETSQSEEMFYESALAFGRFQAMLADYPAETLYETIPDFHNTAKRFRDFQASVERNAAGRLDSVRAEVDWCLAREHYAHAFETLVADGEVPLRVTHNDAKLSNVMIDDATGKGLAVIDLDTVMSGLSMMDFGDGIRSGACTAGEDEPDLSKVHFNKARYDIYLRGFLEGCGGCLTAREEALMPMGAKVITYEQTLRFLADYLDGDTYYHIEREGQNLDRTRTQIRMVEEMERLI